MEYFEVAADLDLCDDLSSDSMLALLPDRTGQDRTGWDNNNICMQSGIGVLSSLVH